MVVRGYRRFISLVFFGAFTLQPVSCWAAAGILFYHDDTRGQRWVLLGRDFWRQDLSDLGGARDKEETDDVTAAREAAEESSFIRDPLAWVKGRQTYKSVKPKGTQTFRDFYHVISKGGDAVRRTRSGGYTMFTAPYPDQQGADIDTEAGRAQFQREFAQRRAHFASKSDMWCFHENDDLGWVPVSSIRLFGNKTGAVVSDGLRVALRRKFVHHLLEQEKQRRFLGCVAAHTPHSPSSRAHADKKKGAPQPAGLGRTDASNCTASGLSAVQKVTIASVVVLTVACAGTLLYRYLAKRRAKAAAA